MLPAALHLLCRQESGCQWYLLTTGYVSVNMIGLASALLCPAPGAASPLTGRAHLQHLSHQVDCSKAAGWEQTGQWAEAPESVVMLSVVNQSCVLLFMLLLLRP